MIKLIAMDMDGTLLTTDNKIDDDTKATLLRMEEKGIRLVLASGRSYMRLMQYAKELKMEEYGGYLIEVNGIALYDLQHGKREVKTQLEIMDVKEIFEFCLPYELEMQALFDDGMFIHIPDRLLPIKKAYREEHHLPEDFPWTRGAMSFMHDNREGYPKQTYITDIKEVKQSVNKVCYAAEKNEIDDIAEAFRKHFKDRFWIGKTTENWLEIMPMGITKGNALLDLITQLHLQKDEILVFGDGENDIEMLQAVTYGIAMKNALPKVKEIAYDSTDDNNHQGIVKAIQKYTS